MFTAALPGNRLSISPRLCSARITENSFPSTVASIRVYEAVAWQRVDQIRYIILLGYEFADNTNLTSSEDTS
jgi:hypothetical protein